MTTPMNETTEITTSTTMASTSKITTVHLPRVNLIKQFLA
jgi:hypothetical protein